MTTLKNVLWITILSFFFVACGGAEQKAEDSSASSEDTETSQEGEQTAEKCMYSYNNGDVKVSWTAFKFTEKTGVSGQFRDVKIQTTEQAENPIELLKNASFEIPVASVDSNDPDRDGKIRQHFFGTLSNTEAMKGSFKSIDGDAKSGEGIISFIMNEQEKELPVKYTIDDNGKIEIKGEMDVSIWDAMPALNKLNEVCDDLHKGADGISKLWPQVEVRITAQLNKDCE
ncbi:MAG: YceI family protein [Bernardetiaceae bacterium]|nr:YceI family protein [Bernardetiaceae bacterium]